MALVRGRTLVPLRAFLKETFGEEGWRRLLGELAPPQRSVLEGLILPDAWYDRMIHRAMLETTARLWAEEMPDIGRRMGARVAWHHDRFYLRPLVKLGGPIVILKRASGLYREYFQGGKMAVLEQRGAGARLLVDDPHAPPFFCRETLLGFAEELIRLSGRRLVRIEQPVCRHQGADHCELDVEWR